MKKEHYSIHFFLGQWKYSLRGPVQCSVIIVHGAASVFLARREHVQKIAFLAGHSAKALTFPYLLAEQKRVYARIFFKHIYIYIFLKPANSDTENGF